MRVHQAKPPGKAKGRLMESQQPEQLPKIGADVETLQKELERIGQHVKRSQNNDDRQGQGDTRMIVRGR